jgi:hypothetical protein
LDASEAAGECTGGWIEEFRLRLKGWISIDGLRAAGRFPEASAAASPVLLKGLVVAMDLSEVLVFEAIDGVLQDVVDRDGGLIGQRRQLDDDTVIMTHGWYLGCG